MDTRNPDREWLVGCDFGLPKRAGDQARKIIAIEAERTGNRRYTISVSGRNRRLFGAGLEDRPWLGRRSGWTLPDWTESLVMDDRPTVVALDFPFGIPQTLLKSGRFAAAIGVGQPLMTRDHWWALVEQRLPLAFSSPSASGEWCGLAAFAPWRQTTEFWCRRATDRAARAQPPLKHIGQALFNMTLGGACLLSRLRRHGFGNPSFELQHVARPMAFETYPALVSRRIGFAGSYKQQPGACLTRAIQFLRQRDVDLQIDARVRRFCETYRTGPKKDDPDGADAFLCLVAAICFREEDWEPIVGDATPAEIAEEGAIIVPTADDPSR